MAYVRYYRPDFSKGAGGRKKPLLFGDCGGFVSQVYGRVGLTISSTFATAEAQATVTDAGEGSLRFFYTNGVLHVGILAGGGQIVDNNNGIYTYPNNGVHLHGADDGTLMGFPNHQYDSMQDKTLPGSATLSILQALDNE
jgi:cell wall-associated NlpC family hydrolase